MTKLHESIIRNADSITHLLEIIKKLEERIITLENFQSLHHTWMARKDDAAGEEYWEHG